MDRVLASEARGRWFDPSRARHRPLPHLVEHRSLGAALPVIGVVLAGLILAGCSTTSTAPSRTQRTWPAGADGPPPAGSDTPDVQQVPDAEPKLEAIRSGGPNKPYEVLGQSYVPMTTDAPLVERGLASWYGRKFHGRRTASGETYNMYAMTAAHKTMPIPSYARVRNPANGREIVVRVNDRGPFSSGRVIDLSYAAAVKLGVQNGVAPVELERITYEDIRAGLANRGPGNLARAPAAPPPPTPVPTPVLAAPQVVVAEAPIAAPAPAPTANAATVAAASPAATEPTERARSYTAAASGFWLQLGAFGRGDGAYSFQQRVAAELDWLSPLLTVFAEGGMHRLQAGPYASRDQAREAAERVRAALALVPVIVERR